MVQLATPSRKQYVPISTRKSLIRHLRWAMSLELSTIPPYLTAMYSLQDATGDAYQVIKSVVIEEMLHLTLVCNLMVSVGGEPRFDAKTVPEYPTYIPHHAAGGPFISLQPLSTSVVEGTFCTIEAPSNQSVPVAEGNDFETIGQFYMAILDGFERLHARLGPELFVDTGAKQLSQKQYFGGGGGRVVVVDDLASARRAIEEIVAQGEGARPWSQNSGSEPYGGRFHYGTRPDGTYGPILGPGAEPSHYQRFVELVDGTASIGATWPMQTNIKADQIADKSLRRLAKVFDGAYTLLLRCIEAAYRGPEAQRLFFEGAVPLMHGVLPALARTLMQTPLDPRTGGLGPNAGPAFGLVDTTPDPRDLAKTLQKLAATPPAGSATSAASAWRASLGSLATQLTALPRLSKG